ncbi:MAG: signal peptidase II [Ignavibacteriae bacterium]|nr:signal peptidase II [Ignavibacteriota bacterium]
MRILFLSLFIVITDQITKLWVKGISLPSLGIEFQGYPYGYSQQVWGDFLRLTYIENPGMAFGIDIGGKLFFSIFSVIASIGIIFYLYKVRDESLLFRLSLAMILGGAVGNLIDRVFYGVIFDEAPLFYGRVVDFIDADFFNINLFGYHLNRWPVFNVADASVTCGVVLLLFAQKTLKQETPILQNSITPETNTSIPTSNTTSLPESSQAPQL